MFSTVRVVFGTIVFVLLLPLTLLLSRLRMRNPREYGLTPADREIEIARKFGARNASLIQSMLQQVREPSEKVLGAIVFLATKIDDFEHLVALANTDPEGLLNAATVKDERAE